jgi:hypothetical protein
MSYGPGNPFITQIIPLFNVSSSPAGPVITTDYSSQITGFTTMIDYINYRINVDTLLPFGNNGNYITVSGDLRLDGQLYINNYLTGPDSTGSNIVSGTSLTVNLTPTNSNISTPIQFITNNNVVFSTDIHGNALFTSSITCQNVYQLSDQRAKTNIVSMVSSLSTLVELQGIKYSVGNSPSLGFLTQNIHRIVPTAVNISMGQQSIEYSQLIPLLVESVKELAAEVKLMRSR